MRALLALLSCVLFAATSWATAWAQDAYPPRPIRLIIPFPPAGITDLSGRLVAEGLREKFKQPVIIENKPGANGVIGMQELLKAEPDGYTLMVGNVGSIVLNYAMDSKVGFDPMKDMVPIAGTAEYSTTMVVNKNVPVNSVKEFIAYSKERARQADLRLDRGRRDGLSRRRGCLCRRPANQHGACALSRRAARA